MNQLVEFVRPRLHSFNRFLRRHRVPVVAVSSILITSLIVQQAFFNNPKEALAALTNIRQEVNIIDGIISAASGAYATSSSIVSIDPAKYTGATYYLEVVASTTSAVNASVSLVNAATGAAARTVTINGTAYDRYRSTSFTIGATTEYKVRVNNESVGKGIIAARIIIIQNNNPISITQTQIEIGARQTYTSGTLSGLSAPKYWKYTSANWDGSPTFYAEVTYARTVDITIASSTTYTTSGSRSFTVPASVSSTTVVQLWGGGGGGGAASTNTTGSGSGGAGGQYARKVISSLAGLTKTVVVATGGPGGVSTAAGTVGGNSTWDTNVVVANGGNGGAINSGAGGTGNTTGAVGDSFFAGGNGAAGTSGGVSGGGGEGARSTATGGSATTGTGGSGGDGGDGANGISTNGTPSAGSAPGGAGAGARSTGNPNADGSAGAVGRAIISYNLNASATTTIKLQESDGTGDGFTGWSDKITIVSGGSASTPTRVRSSSFTPTTGRNYRIAVQEGYNGATHAIYNAKIVVDQASSPTKLEPQYLLANTNLFSGTSLQKYHTYWDSSEWTNSVNTYTHQVDAANNSTSVVEVDTEAGTQVTGSVVTSPDNSGVSSSMTMPATGDLDIKATTNNSDIYASRILVAVTPDTTAPTPNPPRFSTVPTPNSISQVSMTSVTLTDAGAVEYYFTATSSTCGSNLGSGRTNSGWQSSASYSDSGLQTNQCYAYTIKGRDAVGNLTATSTASTTYTLAATPGGPTYGSVGVTSFTISNTENGNPASNPTTNFVLIASSTDARWNNKYLTAAAGTSTTPVWLSDAQVNNLSITSLFPNTRYDFSAVARNQNSVLTATSTRTGTTTLPDTAAPTPNPATFSSAPNDASGTTISMTATAGSDVSTPVSYNFDYSSVCAANNGTGGTDSGWQTSVSYTDTGLEINKCYSYTVQSRDSLSNTGTASAASAAYTAANTPSAPGSSSITGSTFTISNNANSNPSNTEFTVHIAATSPSDTNWNGKYLKADGTPSATAVWLTDAQIDGVVVSGLAFTTQYTLEVKARNGDNEETSYSTQSNVTTLADTTAPTPNPTSFSSGPNNDSTSQISMTTNAVTDPTTPVEYFFDALTGTCGANIGTGGTDSAWQQSTSYSDNGLQTNKCYGYTITARDAALNAGSATAASVTYTSAAVPGQVTLISKSDVAITINNTENGNPASNPTTQFAIFITSADSTWNNKYVDATGNPSVAAVWRSDAQFDGITVLGLQATTQYTFAVKARNQDNDETALGTTQNITTSDPIVPKTILQGVRLQGTRLY